MEGISSGQRRGKKKREERTLRSKTWLSTGIYGGKGGLREVSGGRYVGPIYGAKEWSEERLWVSFCQVLQSSS